MIREGSIRQRCEDDAAPVAPVEVWFAEHRYLLTIEFAAPQQELVGLEDADLISQWWEQFNRRRVAEARLDHLDELASICNDHPDPSGQVDRLGDHVVRLDRQLTSRVVHQDDPEHALPPVEEEIIRAKITDTTSLRTIVKAQLTV